MIQYLKLANKGVLQPVMMLALPRVEKIFNEFGYSAIVISTNDGFHPVGSLHYIGLAVDLRTTHLQTDLVPVVADKIRELLSSLSPSFRVILKTDHIHIEFDRRQNHETIQNAKKT